jgi:WD40 repeat protein
MNRSPTWILAATLLLAGLAAFCLQALESDPLRVFERPDATLTLALSADGDVIATGDRYGSLSVWNVRGGTRRQRVQGHQGWLKAASVAPDGSLIATGGLDGFVRIWDANTEVLVKEMKVGESVFGVSFSPDGSQLAAAIFGDYDNQRDFGTWGELAIYGRGAWDETHHLSLNQTPFSVAFSPDGRQLAAGLYRSQLRVYDIERELNLFTTIEHTADVSCTIQSVEFTSDGSRIASSGWDDVKLWSASTGSHIRTFRVSATPIRVMRICPTGTWIAAGDEDGLIHLWDLDTGRHVRSIEAHGKAVWGFAFSPDGSSLLTASDGLVRRWPLPEP